MVRVNFCSCLLKTSRNSWRSVCKSRRLIFFLLFFYLYRFVAHVFARRLERFPENGKSAQFPESAGWSRKSLEVWETVLQTSFRLTGAENAAESVRYRRIRAAIFPKESRRDRAMYVCARCDEKNEVSLDSFRIQIQNKRTAPTLFPPFQWSKLYELCDIILLLNQGRQNCFSFYCRVSSINRCIPGVDARNLLKASV